jgi:anaerobic selenocysteine-containing dehydrogenase
VRCPKAACLITRAWTTTKSKRSAASSGRAPTAPRPATRGSTPTACFSIPTAKLLALPFIDNNEKPSDDYPFWLNSGRVVEHFHTRTRTGKIGNVNKFSPTPYMEMNPDAAARLNIPHMSYARLISRRGDAVVMVQHTQRVPPDMVFIPFHFHECVNRLTLGLLDPYSRQPAFKQCSVKIEPAPNQQAAAATNVAARSF